MMPFTSLSLQFFKCPCSTFTASSSNCELRTHNRKSKNCKKYKIDKHECRTTIFPAYVWKFPYITKSHRAPGRHQNKAESRAEFFSLFQNKTSIVNIFTLIKIVSYITIFSQPIISYSPLLLM